MKPEERVYYVHSYRAPIRDENKEWLASTTQVHLKNIYLYCAYSIVRLTLKRQLSSVR